MASHSIRIAGGEAVFRCSDGDTILSGALRGGVGLPYECNSGGCGSCQVELVEGDVRDLWPDAPGLSPRARERGRRLACQSAPAGDCVIRARPSEDNVSPVVPARQDIVFVEARRLTHDMSEFRFRTDGPARFLPGQYAMLDLPGVEGPRAYSMSNLPNEEGEWHFIVKRVPGGEGTAMLFDAIEPGRRLTMDAPYGKSFLRTDSARDIVCVGGGSGLSPILSILRGAVRAPELAEREIHLFYGGRGPEDMCLAEIMGDDPLLKDRVRPYLAISDEGAPGASEWQGDRGFIHELVRKTLGDKAPDYEFYFCGPPPMTDSVHRMLLLEHKVSAAQLHFDRFF